MTNFARPKPRFDYNTANDGRWFYIEDENGSEYGGFKCTLLDKARPQYRIALERLHRAYNAGMAKGKRRKFDQNEFEAEFFVEVSLVDWDMKDSAGKAIQYSKDKAIEYFTASEIDQATGEKTLIYGYVLRELGKYVEDVLHFQPETQEELPEKN